MTLVLVFKKSDMNNAMSRPRSEQMSHAHFAWYELVTTDMAAARSFCGGVLGWTARDIEVCLQHFRNAGGRRGQRIRNDRQHHRTRAPAQRRRPKKDGEDQAIGRSKGGLSAKIHAMVDALGNPLAFFLTAGQAHDLQGADMLLPQMQADTLLADKAFDPDERVIEPLLAAGKKLVIPSKSNRKVQRPYDKEMYKARHLRDNFYCKVKQYRAIATRYDKTARNFLAGIHLVAAVIWLN